MRKRASMVSMVAWMAGYLAIIDVAVNIIFPFPRSPRSVNTPELIRFFEYGRSVEGKLARMTRTTDEESSPVLKTGWISEPRVRVVSEGTGSPDRPTITIYGMSHSVQLANDMARIDPSMPIRSVGAPGAVPSWSYSAYLSDRDRYHSGVVILAVMTKGVPYICTTSGATNHFDSVWPYTYPRLILQGDRLISIPPPFLSLDGYRANFFDPSKWQRYVDWLRIYDRHYDPVLYRRTALDHSSLFRMLRRAYAYAARRKKETRVYDDRAGFYRDSEEVKILLSMTANFAREARDRGSVPIIYLVNNLFTGRHLFELMKDTLAVNDIPYLSSHTVSNPDDPRNYLPDSHFTPEENLKLAGAMLELVRELEKGRNLH